MRRKTKTIGVLLVQTAAVLLLGSCTKSTDLDMEISGDSGAIRFAGPAVTRAAIDNTDGLEENGRAFSVWGNYTDGASTTNVFDGEKVTYGNGAWSYDGTRYWHLGNTYNFTAWYPDISTISEASSSVNSSNNGISEIQGFDATKGHDLMTAEQTVQTNEGEDPGPVNFAFRHLLARVEIVGKADAASESSIPGFTVTVTNAKLYGLPAKGDYTPGSTSDDGTWDNPTEHTTETNPYIGLGGKTVELTTDGSNIFGEGNCLVIPGNVTDAYEFSVTYTVTSADDQTGTTATQKVSLAALELEKLEAGRSYRFSFTVADKDHIWFAPPTVNAWDDATGGIIVVE